MTLSKDFKIFLACIIPIAILILWFYISKGGQISAVAEMKKTYSYIRESLIVECYEIENQSECGKKNTCEWEYCPALHPSENLKGKNFCTSKSIYDKKEFHTIGKKGFACPKNFRGILAPVAEYGSDL